MVTIFKDFVKPVKNVPLQEIMDEIKSPVYVKQLLEIYSLTVENRTEEAKQLKKQLPAFTIAGVFEGGRTANNLKKYSYIIGLDYDDLTLEQRRELKKKVESISYTKHVFISPSGYGLKVFVEVAPNDSFSSIESYHQSAYSQVASYYVAQLGLPIDEKCKDIARLCFFSADKGAYSNPNSEKFPVKFNDEKSNDNKLDEIAFQQCSENTENFETAFGECIAFTEQKTSFVEGNRNAYIYQLCCNLNRAGVPPEIAYVLIPQRFDLPEHEISSSIKSAYKNVQEFGKFSKVESSRDEQAFQEETPKISSDVYTKLPQLFTNCCSKFNNDRQRDVFFTTAITVLSGCISTIQGQYDGQTVFANLSCFIVAPPASDKSVMKFSRKLGEVYHDKLVKESREKKKEYKRWLKNLENFKADQSQISGGQFDLEEPPFKMLFIPGNSSSAAVTKQLMQNEEKGIFCESEADSLINALKQDWGNYSDLLRKAFLHEVASSKRIGNDGEYIELKCPQLSVALTGTPSQQKALISSHENGLFSRIIWYTYSEYVAWRSMKPSGSKEQNLTSFFESMSYRVAEMIEFWNDTNAIFEWQSKHWDFFDRTFSGWLEENKDSEAAAGSIKRLGLITYRIAMVLTAVRYFEKNKKCLIIECNDEDFQTAMSLAETYKAHMLQILSSLPNQTQPLNDKATNFYASLPQTFSRKEAVVAGFKLLISERSVDMHLKSFLKNQLLFSEGFGRYRKSSC